MKRKLLLITLVGALLAAAALFWAYPKLYGPNVATFSQHQYLCIPTDASYQEVCDELQPYLLDAESFKWVADLKSYPTKIKAGRYDLGTGGQSNNTLINLLRSGNQQPVKLTFTPTRYTADIAGKIGRVIEADSAAIHAAMVHPDTAAAYGFKPEEFAAMFIPNTYEIYWNTNVHAFLQRMHSEYNRFWTEGRQAQAKKRGVSPVQVATLASIIQEEIVVSSEANRVAGVYLNRVKARMRLDADPTLKFAAGDWTLRRVLDRHKTIDSPYNTYKYPGIPPGPIVYPSPKLLKAVLEAEEHKFYYFVALPDGSGKHHFSKNYAEHLRYARQYQRNLNRRGIY